MTYRKLSDLLDLNELSDMVTQGYIRVQTHPDFPELGIYNYSEKATFEHVWNRSTRLCRGLIVDRFTGFVLAIPFPKFHNSTEAEAESFDGDGLVDVYDKVDGSCGIFYVTPDGQPAIATRGSFASDQAIHATRVLRSKYADWANWLADTDRTYTPIFEIVYPENRIVLSYDFDDLVLLGATDFVTGKVMSANLVPGPLNRVQRLAFRVTMQEAMSLPDRENAEGVVIRSCESHEQYWDVQQQVKVKQSDYIALHKIVTNLSDRAIWELGPDGDVAAFISVLPDEFHEWAKKVHTDLVNKLTERTAALVTVHRQAVESLSAGYSQKDFAMAVKDLSWSGYMFSLEQGRSIQDKIWQSLKPAAVDKLGVDV